MEHGLGILKDRKVSLTGLAVATLLFLAQANGACSVIVAGRSTQCETDTDCPSTATCNTSGRCVDKPQCVTTQDCIALGPTLTSGGWAAYDDYLANGYDGQIGGTNGKHGMPGFGEKDFVGNDATGKPFTAPIKVPTRICAKGQCVALRDSGEAQCAADLDEQQIYGNPNAPNPLVVGVMADLDFHNPSTIPNDPGDPGYATERYYVRAAALPFLELREAVGSGSIAGREILVIGCSQQRNVSRSATPAATHLADLDAKVVIGPTGGTAFKDAANVLVAAGIPLISPFVMTNTAAQTPNSDGLLYFPSFFAGDILPPLNGIIADRERALKSALQAAGQSRPLKVAVYYYSDDAFKEYDQLKPLIEQKLILNGSPVIVQGNDVYQAFSFDPTSTDPNVSSQTALIKGITDFHPDIVIPFAGATEWAGIFNQLDAVLSATPTIKTSDGKVATPVWVTPLILNDQLYYDPSQVKNNVNNAQARVTGIRPARSSLYPTIQAEMTRLIGDTPIDYRPGVVRAYETSLLAFYSMAAAAEIHKQAAGDASAFTGRDVAAGVVRVTTGMTAIEASPSPSILNNGLNLLNDGQPIKLNGVFSNLVFDDLHHTNVTWETFCVDVPNKVNVSSRALSKDGTLGALAANSPCGALGY